MSWSSYEDKPSKDELKLDAERLRSDWVAVRVSESAIQAGFSAPIDGIKTPSKLSSLAAMLADSYEQPWLGIFKISDGLWWYIAVRDGHAVLPDGDVIGGQEEIIAARDRHAGYGDWNFVEGDLSALAELINQIDAKVTPVRSLTTGNLSLEKVSIAGFIVIAIICGGAWWWHQKQLAEEQARALERAKLKAQLASGAPIAPIASPLITSPTPETWLSACRSVIYKLPISSYGWKIKKVACNTSNVLVTWNREDGATVANRPDGNISEQGDTIEQNIALGALENGKEDNTIELQDAKTKLRAWAQAANLTLAFVSNAPPALPGATTPTGPDGKTLPAQRPNANITIDMPISPFGLELSVIPGLRLTSLNSTDKDWHLEGTLYGR